MTHSYTSNQIIQYLYRELPLAEHLETEYAVATNSEWKKAYMELKSAFSVLPQVQFFPKGRIIRAIMKHSAQTGVGAG